MAELRDIASLWIGDRLSWLEQLCLKSFADRGHRVRLYSYTPIDNLPPGVDGCNAADIFAQDTVWRHGKTGSPAIHADLWRLHLMAKTQAIWVDTDMYCWRPFDFAGDHIFGLEGPAVVCNAVLRVPQSGALLDQLLGFFDDPYVIPPWFPDDRKRDLQARADAGQPVHLCDQPWGLTGPYVVTYMLRILGLFDRAQGQSVFYPVDFDHRNRVLRPRFKAQDLLAPDTRGVHFWARRVKARLADREGGVPRPGSFLDSCLDQHGIDPAAAPIQG